MAQPPKRPVQEPFMRGGFQTQVPNQPRTGREQTGSDGRPDRGSGVPGYAYGQGPLGYLGGPQRGVVNPSNAGPAPVADNQASLDEPPGLDAGPKLSTARPPREVRLEATMPPFTLEAKGTVIKNLKPKRIVVRDKKQVFIQSHVLIVSLEEALSYDPAIQHNQAKPEIYVALDLGRPNARLNVEALIAELRRLNELLAAIRPPVESQNKAIIDLRKHLNTFLEAGAKTCGVGSGLLVLGAMSSLLHHLGGRDIVDFALQFKSK